MRKFALLSVLFTAVLLIGCETQQAVDSTPLPPPPTMQVVDTDDADITPSAAPLVVETNNGDDGGVEVEEVVETVEIAPAQLETEETEPELAAEPTETPTVEPPPELVIQTPLQLADPNNLPTTTRDLLFVVDGALKLWTAHNRQLTELVADGVTDTAVSADGNRVLVARQIFEGEITLLIDHDYDSHEDFEEVDVRYTEHELLLVDTVSKQSRVIAPMVPLLQKIAFSPSGDVMSFVAHDLVSKQDSEPFVFPSLNLYFARPDSGEVRLLQACDLICSGMSWRDDGELMIYSDHVGLWLYNISAAAPEILIEGGDNVKIGAPRYEPIEWSGNGRTVLLHELAGNNYNGQFVYDLVNRTRSTIPDTRAYSEISVRSIDWLADERLLLTIDPIDLSDRRGVRLELWRFSVDESGSLVVDEGITMWTDEQVHGEDAVHLEDGRFAYAITHQTDPNIAGLYIQQSLTSPAERVGNLPTGWTSFDVVWSPDGSGALVQWRDDVVYLAQTNGAMVNMTAVLGADLSDIVWLEPSAAVR